MNDLIPYDEYVLRRKELRESKKPVPLGVACHDCGTELFDDIGGVIGSVIPTRHASCNSCNWMGYLPI